MTRPPAADGGDAPRPRRRPARDRPWPRGSGTRSSGSRRPSSASPSAACGRPAGSHIPARAGSLLVSNHLSHLDVFVLGIPTPRPLNYVARSTLFLPLLGAFIRSVGGFPIQREGMGASGVKETLRRVRKGGVVLLFPEGTRSRDGRLARDQAGDRRAGLRARCRSSPRAWPGRSRPGPGAGPSPLPHPIRIAYGAADPPRGDRRPHHRVAHRA